MPIYVDERAVWDDAIPYRASYCATSVQASDKNFFLVGTRIAFQPLAPGICQPREGFCPFLS